MCDFGWIFKVSLEVNESSPIFKNAVNVKNGGRI